MTRSYRGLKEEDPGRILLARGVVRMKKGILLSLSILLIVVCSAFLIGFFGVQCQLWSRVALSGSKKIATRLLMRELSEINTADIFQHISTEQLSPF